MRGRGHDVVGSGDAWKSVGCAAATRKQGEGVSLHRLGAGSQGSVRDAPSRVCLIEKLCNQRDSEPAPTAVNWANEFL